MVALLLQNLLRQKKPIQETIAKSGNTIVADAEDMIDPLIAKRDALKGTVGNEDKIAAIDQLITEIGAKFKKGFTAQGLLDLKRAGDEDFGKAVVDDTKGTVAAQAQKLLTNRARAILKTTFPDVAKSLDTQSELYTLKPILGAARAKDITAGTGLAKIDLTKPGTIAQAATANPRVSSTLNNVVAPSSGESAGLKFLNGESPVLEKAGLPSDVQMPTKGQMAGRVAAQQATNLMLPGDTQQTADNNIEGQNANTQQDIGTNNGIDHNGSDYNTNPAESQGSTATGYTVEQLAQAYSKALMAGDKAAATQLKSMYDLEAGYKKANGAGGKSNVAPLAAKDAGTIQAGLANLQDVRKMLTEDPTLLQKQLVPGQPFSRQLDSALYDMADTLLRLRTGAQANPAEIKGYMSKIAPSWLDSPDDIKYKLDKLERDLQEYANAGGTAVPVISGMDINSAIAQ
jgi:hypothetical protein